MNAASKTIYCLFFSAITSLLLINTGHAEGHFYVDQNLTQKEETVQQFELSSGQIRRRVEHKLINFILGRTVDQYIDLGIDDEAAIKSSKKLRLRVSNHHLILVYQYSFF